MTSKWVVFFYTPVVHDIDTHIYDAYKLSKSTEINQKICLKIVVANRNHISYTQLPGLHLGLLMGEPRSPSRYPACVVGLSGTTPSGTVHMLHTLNNSNISFSSSLQPVLILGASLAKPSTPSRGAMGVPKGGMLKDPAKGCVKQRGC